MRKDTSQKLGGLTIGLHWIVAIGMISLLAVGTYMSRTDTYWMYPLHKSFGMLIFSVILLRVIWRIVNGFPEGVRPFATWEKIVSRLTHWVLLLGTLAMPLTGVGMTYFGGRDLTIFGVELVGANMIDGERVPHNIPLATFSHEVHEYLSYVLIAAVILHIGAALKHHVIDKDATLRRMLGKRV